MRNPVEYDAFVELTDEQLDLVSGGLRAEWMDNKYTSPPPPPPEV